MQTFITDLPEFGYGLRYLDQKRVVKQLLETRQIMSALTGNTRGWVNHPATKMWRGKEDMLWDYGRQNALELDHRGYQWQNNFEQLTAHYEDIANSRYTNGDWSRDDYTRVLYTHRGRLWEKDSDYYSNWSLYSDFYKYVCCDRCNYYWPTHLEQGLI
jgi:hypothetical protein